MLDTPAAIQGASSEDGGEVRVLRPKRAAPADIIRPTRAEVNLGHLRHNLHAVARSLGSNQCRIWGVLKADAYGHGAPAVARTLERANMHGFCVALLEEAMELRDAGIKAPILVMGGYFGPGLEGFEELVEQRITPVLYEPGHVERLATVLKGASRPQPFGVHLKIDTGMGRLGVRPEELATFMELVQRFPTIRIEGLMTHFARADEADTEFTGQQIQAFHSAAAVFRQHTSTTPLLHAANSAALLSTPEAQFDAVRPGIALFGGSGKSPALKPVMRVRTEIVAIRQLQTGDGVGYGQSWRASRPSLIATVPIGYADGLSRHMSNRGHLLVRGKRVPVVGAVSMDMTTIDVTDAPGSSIRDEVIVLGSQEGPLGKDEITTGELAEIAQTIPWEIMTTISRRVPRFYREP